MKLFVLTAEEKRVIAFVLLMILLGLGVKEYRKSHSPVRPPEQSTAAQEIPDLSNATPASSGNQTPLPEKNGRRAIKSRARQIRTAVKSSPADIAPDIRSEEDNNLSSTATPPP